MTKSGLQTSYWYCYLWGGEQQSKGHGHRSKKVRIHAPCGMRLKKVQVFELLEGAKLKLLRVEISLHVDKKEASFQHNHDLDMLKINSYVMRVVGTEIARGWEASRLRRLLFGVKFAGNLTALGIAGGKHLTLKHIHNAAADWKKSHPDDSIAIPSILANQMPANAPIRSPSETPSPSILSFSHLIFALLVSWWGQRDSRLEEARRKLLWKPHTPHVLATAGEIDFRLTTSAGCTLETEADPISTSYIIMSLLPSGLYVWKDCNTEMYSIVHRRIQYCFSFSTYLINFHS